MAPEVLANFKTPGSSPYNKRCDIFSYGVLLWEIFHCTCPYADTGCVRRPTGFVLRGSRVSC